MENKGSSDGKERIQLETHESREYRSSEHMGQPETKKTFQRGASTLIFRLRIAVVKNW